MCVISLTIKIYLTPLPGTLDTIVSNSYLATSLPVCINAYVVPLPSANSIIVVR